MSQLPDLSSLPIGQLRAWSAAVGAAIAALEAKGGGQAAIFADADGLSVTFSIEFPEEH